MKSSATSDTNIYSTHRHPFIHGPAVNSICGWLAEHGCSRSCISSPIRRLCRSNYVSVVHKPVATCYPNSLDSHFPWHDPLPLFSVQEQGLPWPWRQQQQSASTTVVVVVMIWLSWCMGRVVPSPGSRLPASSPESHTAYLAWMRCMDGVLNRRGV